MKWQSSATLGDVRCHKIAVSEHFSEVTTQKLLVLFFFYTSPESPSRPLLCMRETRDKQMIESTFPEVKLFSINSHLVISF